MHSYDVIVLGTGGVGAAAAMHLARRGAKVLGLDRFDPPHDHGSSHGRSRVIRMAYFEHPAYVPLLRRSYELWRELEHRTTMSLFHEVGLLEIGPPAGVVIPGVLRSAARHDLPVERIARDDFTERFPQFHLPAGSEAVLERNAGYLSVEQCVLAHLQEARRAGAELHADEPVVSWQAAGDRSVIVQTERAEYHAAKLVVAAGAWSGPLATELGVPLRVLRKHLHWFDCPTRRYHVERGTPTFFFELDDGSFYYGFPQLDGQGVKIAEHGDGQLIAGPSALDRSDDPAERARVRSFARRCLPELSGDCTQHAVCLYTMTPDEHFLVDIHPVHRQVAFAVGLSGHGFKFAAVLGELLADLTLDGRASLTIDFLGMQRF